jgi:hypothetical protein
MADFHSDFLDAYFKGAALGQENRNRQQLQAQFNARQAQEAAETQQRFAMEQQTQANAKAYQDAMVAQGKQRMDWEQANKLRDDARAFELAQGQYVPTPQAKTVDVGNVAPMAPQQAPSTAPVGPQVPSDVQAQNLPIANRDAGQTLFNTQSQISPQAQLQDQGFRASQAYDAPQGMTAVLPTQEAARAQALAASQAGFVDTPADIQAMGFGPKMDPKILQGIREKQIESGKASPAQDTHDFMQTISQLQQTEGLPPNALTDIGQLRTAIENSKLPADQKAKAVAYLATKTTPESTATVNILRAAAFGATKEYQGFGPDGNLTYANANRINSGIPFTPAGPCVPAMQQAVRFDNLANNISSMRDSVNKMGDLSPQATLMLAYAKKQSDPTSTLQTFAQSEAMQHLDANQQEFIRNLAVLSEDAQALSKQAGAQGVGQDMRERVQALLPTGTVSKDYSLKQLDALEKVVSTLKGGVPGTAATPSGKPTTTNKRVQWTKDANGNPIPAGAGQ